ncbi:hypothetical protein CYCD_07340 [Tenuifilaceae bacterium CYCD]|nr:hypothetical protein CYCD_07340 [Tenuifilaceae bacterium CYCD]
MIKKTLNILLSVFLLVIPSIYCFGQKIFVTFETTNNSYVACQGGVLGIIANINPEYANYKKYEWRFNKENFSKIKDEIATVNTSLPGDKKLVFSITLNNNQQLDTAIYVKVLPRPAVRIYLLDNSIRVDETVINIESYKWMLNNGLVNEFVSQPYNKPQVGLYKVIVKDKNGCIGISDPIQVK